DGLPFNTRFGNGDAIGADVVQAINEAYEANTVREGWQAGDLLLVDNLRTAHGREPFEGPREVVVAMADPVRVTDGSPTIDPAGGVGCDVRSLRRSGSGARAPGGRAPDHHAGRRRVPDARTLRLYDPREERRSDYRGRRPDVPAAGPAGTGPDSARGQALCRAQEWGTGRMARGRHGTGRQGRLFLCPQHARWDRPARGGCGGADHGALPDRRVLRSGAASLRLGAGGL